MEPARYLYSLVGDTSSWQVVDGDRQTVIDEVDRSLTATQWADFAEYKKFFPVWGGPPGYSKAEVARLVSSGDLGMNLVFDSGQPADVVRRTLQAGTWNPSLT